MLRRQRSVHEYLLLPSHPTPNGRLHLGHIAGPYLKLDVLRRALVRAGNRVCTMFALDSYDSYVLLRALQTASEPAEVVTRHKQEIIDDLAALDIDVDVLIDPIDTVWKALYTGSIRESISRLRDAGSIEHRQESFLYCDASSRVIVGCWLLGTCPGCGSEAGSYSCEACGLHYRPEEVGNARSRLEEGILRAITVRTMFLRIRNEVNFQHRLEAMRLPKSFEEIVRRYIERSGSQLRVSVPGTWGVPINAVGEKSQVIFPGFASLGLLLAFGDEYRRRFGGLSAFHPESAVFTVCSFGLDNTVSRIMSCVGGALELPNCRPPDYFLLNYFYRLQGQKFSTSRNHAIWASNIGTIDPWLSDAVRLYLIETSPDMSETDFLVDGFLSATERLFDKLNHSIQSSIAMMAVTPQVTTVPEGIAEQLARALEDQEQSVDLRRFQIRESTPAIHSWISHQATCAPNAQYWWAKGLALLMWPVLSKLSTWLWMYLGHDGAPLEAEYLRLTIPRRERTLMRLTPPDFALIKDCLPSSLR